MPLTSSWTKGGATGSEKMTDKTPYANDGRNYYTIIGSDYATFDGNGDYVDCGNPSILDFPTNDFAISLWMNSNSTPNWTANPSYSGIASAILDKGTGSYIDGYGVWFTKDNTINFVSDSQGEGTGRHDLKSATILSLGEWYHIVIQRKTM